MLKYRTLLAFNCFAIATYCFVFYYSFIKNNPRPLRGDVESMSERRTRAQLEREQRVIAAINSLTNNPNDVYEPAGVVYFPGLLRRAKRCDREPLRQVFVFAVAFVLFGRDGAIVPITSLRSEPQGVTALIDRPGGFLSVPCGDVLNACSSESVEFDPQQDDDVCYMKNGRSIPKRSLDQLVMLKRLLDGDFEECGVVSLRSSDGFALTAERFVNSTSPEESPPLCSAHPKVIDALMTMKSRNVARLIIAFLSKVEMPKLLRQQVHDHLSLLESWGRDLMENLAKVAGTFESKCKPEDEADPYSSYGSSVR